MGLDFVRSWWEILTMNTTAVREKGQVTLPQEIRDQAKIGPGDHIAWVYHDGTIHGTKLIHQESEEIDVNDVDPKTLFPRRGKVEVGSINKAIRADREYR